MVVADPGSFTQMITLDYKYLCNTTVSSYEFDDVGQKASVTFKVKSSRTRAFRMYPSVQVVTADQIAAGVSVIVAAAWADVWTRYHDIILDFVASEAVKPGPSQIYDTPVFVPLVPVWGEAFGGTPTTLTYPLAQNVSYQLRCDGATTYALVNSTGTVPSDSVSPTGLLTVSAGSAAGSWTSTKQPTLTKTLNVRASSSTGTSLQTITIVQASDLVIVTPATLNMVSGQPVSIQIQVTNAVSFSGFVQNDTALGLSLSPTGLLTGTPVAHGGVTDTNVFMTVSSANPLNDITIMFDIHFVPQ